MSDIDFPDSPTSTTVFAAGRRLWKFDTPAWKLVPFGAEVPTEGTMDGGSPVFSLDTVRANAGAPKSDFTGLTSIDGGAV